MKEEDIKAGVYLCHRDDKEYWVFMPSVPTESGGENMVFYSVMEGKYRDCKYMPVSEFCSYIKNDDGDDGVMCPRFEYIGKLQGDK